MKTHYFCCLALLLISCNVSLAQRFSFESQKVKTTGYDKRLEVILNNNDVKQMGKLLDKEKSLVNAISSYTLKDKRQYLSTGAIPLLYDAVNRCLEGCCTVEMVKVILDRNPYLYCSFNHLTPFYLLMQYIGTHRIEECATANELAQLFMNRSDFDVNKKHKELAPPMQYLLTVNYDFLGGTYNKDYISSELIKLFIDKGVSITAQDKNKSTISLFASLAERKDLLYYSISKGANITHMNAEKRDVLYYAIQNDDITSVRTILNSGYPLSESRLREINANEVLNDANEVIREEIFSKLKLGNKTLSQFLVISSLFPEKRSFFIGDNYERERFLVSNNELPLLIDCFEGMELAPGSIYEKNITALKMEYILSVNNLHQFVEANNLYPIIILKQYSTDYYQNEEKCNALLEEISANNVIPTDMRLRFIKEITGNQNNFLTESFKNASAEYLVSMCRHFPSRRGEIIDKALQRFLHGSLSDQIILYNGFPERRKDIEDAAYSDHINLPYLRSFSKEDYYVEIEDYMENELSELKKKYSSFISCFSNEIYLSKASHYYSKVNEHYYALERLIPLAKNYYERLSERFGKVIVEIIHNGKVPNYNIVKTEIEPKCNCIRYTVVYNYSDYEISIYIIKRGDKFYQVRYEYLTMTEDIYFYGASIEEIIRRRLLAAQFIDAAVGSYMSHNDNDIIYPVGKRDYYHMIKCIDYLENNINGEWWWCQDRHRSNSR